MAETGQIISARFLGSSAGQDSARSTGIPEFALIGRSNVGKSSLINSLCHNSKLAKTSSTPGKTRLINRFLIDGKWCLVDLPGYGYAKVNDSQRRRLQEMIDGYILESPDLVCLFVLVDSRHDMGKADLDFIRALGENGVPFSIIFTKCDKLGPVALETQIERNRTRLLEEWEELPPMFRSSSRTGMGGAEILGYISELLKDS